MYSIILHNFAGTQYSLVQVKDVAVNTNTETQLDRIIDRVKAGDTSQKFCTPQTADYSFNLKLDEHDSDYTSSSVTHSEANYHDSDSDSFTCSSTKVLYPEKSFTPERSEVTPEYEGSPTVKEVSCRRVTSPGTGNRVTSPHDQYQKPMRVTSPNTSKRVTSPYMNQHDQHQSHIKVRSPTTTNRVRSPTTTDRVRSPTTTDRVRLPTSSNSVTSSYIDQHDQYQSPEPIAIISKCVTASPVEQVPPVEERGQNDIIKFVYNIEPVEEDNTEQSTNTLECSQEGSTLVGSQGGSTLPLPQESNSSGTSESGWPIQSQDHLSTGDEHERELAALRHEHQLAMATLRCKQELIAPNHQLEFEALQHEPALDELERECERQNLRGKRKRDALLSSQVVSATQAKSETHSQVTKEKLLSNDSSVISNENASKPSKQSDSQMHAPSSENNAQTKTQNTAPAKTQLDDEPPAKKPKLSYHEDNSTTLLDLRINKALTDNEKSSNIKEESNNAVKSTESATMVIEKVMDIVENAIKEESRNDEQKMITNDLDNDESHRISHNIVSASLIKDEHGVTKWVKDELDSSEQNGNEFSGDNPSSSVNGGKTNIISTATLIGQENSDGQLRPCSTGSIQGASSDEGVEAAAQHTLIAQNDQDEGNLTRISLRVPGK